MFPHPVWAAGVSTVLALCMVSPLFGQPPPLGAKTGGVLVGDMDLDKIYLTRDLNGDGDADDDNESWVYFDASNGSGLPNPTGAVYAIYQSNDGWVYYGDGGTKAVYRIRDLNGNRNALDPGEANIWFSEALNHNQFTLNAPNGIYEDSTGALYILNAGTTTLPDAIYRTVDLNADGDANDENEATLWMDVQNLIPNSSAFSITFIGDVAYFADLVGANPDAIFRAYDANQNGTIEPGEFNVFIDESSPLGVQVGTCVVTDGMGLYISESLATVNPQKIFQLIDWNANGVIDDPSEILEVWNETCVPPGFELGSSYGLAIGPGGELLVASAGTDIRDNVFRLVHVNFDPDFMDPGETIVWVSAHGGGVFADYARSLDCLVLTGDMNCDGRIDFGDINPFVLALSDPPGYQAAYPYCRWLNADCNADGQVNFDDINPFVALLSGS